MIGDAALLIFGMSALTPAPSGFPSRWLEHNSGIVGHTSINLAEAKIESRKWKCSP